MQIELIVVVVVVVVRLSYLAYDGCALKPELSFRIDTIIVFFFAANKNKDNTKNALASFNT